MNKKILVIISNDYQYDQRVQKIVGSLKKMNFDVSILGRKQKSNTPTQYNNLTLLNLLFKRGPLFYLELNIRIIFHLFFSKYPYIYAVDVDTIGAAALFKFFWKEDLFLVFDSHEIFHEVPEVTQRPLVKWIWKTIGKWGALQSDRCITVSQSYKEYLENEYKTHFDVIKNVPSQTPQKQSELPTTHFESNTIVYQGALNKGRGLNIAIDAMTQLPEMKLLIAGEGPLRSGLEQMVANKNLNKNIIFLGNLPPLELKKITSSAFLGLNLLTINSPSYFRSLANKFFDYMYAGIPSINPIFPEYISITKSFETGICIEQSSVALVTAITQLKSNEKYYTRLCQNSIKAQPYFNWSHEEKTLQNLFSRKP